jgi:pyruvoyl-dependent arginine decarboxylase (PvlArgDC)
MAAEGFKTRGYELKEVVSICAQHKISKIGAAYAAVVLWW